MNDEHEELLDQWESKPMHTKNCFIQDGIIDPERWSKAKRKILFINKEAHDGEIPDPDGFDLRKIILKTRNGVPTRGTYKVVATWAYALHNASANPADPFPSWHKIDQDLQREALLSCAVMNIKKSRGKTSSLHNDLETFVKEDGLFIKKQVDLINPDIIVCGHVWYLIQHLWSDCRQVYDDVFEVEADGRTFIAFWHPANHAPEQMNYYALAALLQNSKALARYSIS